MKAEAIRTEHRTRILIGLILGLILSAVEVSIVATAMPDVIENLGGEHLYSLPFAIYLLLSTVSSPLWGYTSDRYGSRRLYIIAISLFLLGSGLCGAAQSMVGLVVFRAIQGLGAGGLMTITFTIIGELYALNERSRIQGYLSAVWGVSALVGPLIGGFIVDAFSWRWIFYLNIPFGLAGMVLVYASYRDWHRSKSGRPDLVGALVFSLGAGLLVYGLETHNFGLGLIGLLGLLVFVPLELRQDAPLIPVRLLRENLLLRTVLGNLLAGMAFFGITAYIPLFVQQARNGSATLGGAILSPMTVGWAASAIVVARLLPRLGTRVISRVGAVGMTVGFALLMFSLEAPLWIMGATGLISGSGMGWVMLALLLGAQEQAPRPLLGSITALILFSRTVGGALGSSLMGAALGTSLEQGGAALRDAFWIVPATSTLLALGVLLIVFRLPEPEQQAQPDQRPLHVEAREELYESSARREPGP